MGRIASGAIGLGAGAAVFVGMHEVTNNLGDIGEAQTNYTEDCARYLGSSGITLSGLNDKCGRDDFKNQKSAEHTAGVGHILSVQLPSSQEYLQDHLAAAKRLDKSNARAFDIIEGFVGSAAVALAYIVAQQSSKNRARVQRRARARMSTAV